MLSMTLRTRKILVFTMYLELEKFEREKEELGLGEILGSDFVLRKRKRERKCLDLVKFLV